MAAYTNGFITALEDNEVIIFGSNLAGAHAGGAARQAHKDFGAEWGVFEGMIGKTYAFPTLDSDYNKLTVDQLESSRDRLYETANQNPDKTFLLTKVGCGIAGFEESEMRALFRYPPSNITLPEDWL